MSAPTGSRSAKIEAEALVDHCGKPAKDRRPRSPSSQGSPTGAVQHLSQARRHHQRAVAKHPEIKVVSDQAANYDPAKARAIMETVLQQHPDLCGVVGIWDNQDVGPARRSRRPARPARSSSSPAAAATRAAATTSRRACSSVDISYNVPLQGDIADQQIAELLLTPAQGGRAQDALLHAAHPDHQGQRSRPRNCWTMDDLK